MTGAAFTRGESLSVFTQCSKCDTVFKLSAQALRSAGGQVRCGRCGEVFNALARLAEDASAFEMGESALDLEARADSILESIVVEQAVTATGGSVEDLTNPGIEVAHLRILDWDLGEPADDTVTQSSDTSMEFTLPPGELDRIFVDSKARRLPVGFVQEIEYEPPPDPPSRDTEVHVAPPVPPISPATLPPTLPSTLPPTSPPTSPPTPASTETGDDLPDEVRFEILSATGNVFDMEMREPARESFGLWLGAAIFFALVLIGQIVHQNRDWLATHSPLSGVLRTLYMRVGAPVTVPANFSAYQLRQWGVTGDPTADATLRVRASILNAASQLEPYPLLRVTLANRFGARMGSRDFEPSEYMGKPVARMLAPGESIDATLQILDPGKNAEGFEIDVCLRGAEKKITCASDVTSAPDKR